MHNPTRRVKRLKQPLSSNRPPNPLAETSQSQFHFALGEVSPSRDVQYRQVTQPDLLRGLILIALIVVTFVLYFVLCELERASFASVPKPSLTQSTTAPYPSVGNPAAASVRYPPRIVRDPPVVPLVQESNLSSARNAAPSSKPSRTMPSRWPPPITRVPDEYDTEDVPEKVNSLTHEGDVTKLPSFDATYCNGTCRFLLPVRVGEQESKARVHFTQLSSLARRLNRTIVLPNVAKSRMSACSAWPFGAYYDTNGFDRGRDSPDLTPPLAMNLDVFAKWLDERPVPPNSLLVSMESIHQDRRDFLGTQTDVPFVVEKAEVDPKISSCLESKLARLRSAMPETALVISIDSGSPKAHPDVSTPLVQFLTRSLDLDADSDFDLVSGPGYEHMPQAINASRLSLADLDVLVLDYDLRHPLSAAPESPLTNIDLHYAPALHNLADRLADNLGPFLAIHWRMETVPVQNLAWCAASLVHTLYALLQDDVAGKDVQRVWLATDHPRPFLVDDDASGGAASGFPLREYGPLKKSSTLKALLLEHDDAIGILTEAFQPGGDLETWKLTDLAEQLRRYPYVEGRFDVNETLLDDSGVFGILDKLVAMQARVFISGSKDCSKTSSFSKQITETREKTFGIGEGAIHKVVEYFGEW